MACGLPRVRLAPCAAWYCVRLAWVITVPTRMALLDSYAGSFFLSYTLSVKKKSAKSDKNFPPLTKIFAD